MYLRLKAILISTDGKQWKLKKIFYLSNRESKDEESEFISDSSKHGIEENKTMFELAGVEYNE